MNPDRKGQSGLDPPTTHRRANRSTWNFSSDKDILAEERNLTAFDLSSESPILPLLPRKISY